VTTGGRLAGRLIGLGVTGSIAAYKAVELLRLLRAEGDYAWVRSQGYVVREAGRPVRIIGAMADISRRR